MRSVAPHLLAIMLAGMASSASHAQEKLPEDDLIGDWILPENGYVIHADRCIDGDAFCAQIVRVDDPARRDSYNPELPLRRRPLLGIIIAANLYKRGPATWQGSLYNPRNGFTYKGKLKLIDRSRFTFEGCLLSFLFCETKTFYRVEPPPVAEKPQKPASPRRAVAQNRPPLPAAKAKPVGKEPTRADFEDFIKERETTGAAPVLTDQQRQALFKEFLAWRSKQ